LEEERKSDVGQVMTYFNGVNGNNEIRKNPNDIINDVLSKNLLALS
jgi:hypothetical protein